MTSSILRSESWSVVLIISSIDHAYFTHRRICCFVRVFSSYCVFVFGDTRTPVAVCVLCNYHTHSLVVCHERQQTCDWVIQLDVVWCHRAVWRNPRECESLFCFFWINYQHIMKQLENDLTLKPLIHDKSKCNLWHYFQYIGEKHDLLFYSFVRFSD